MSVYFDNSSTTKVCENAVNAAVSGMKSVYGNPSSLHKMGIEAENIISRARKTILNALNRDGNLIFTSGATESNNLAVLGCAKAYKRKGNKIITTDIEHPSVLAPLKELEKSGFEIIYVSPFCNGVLKDEASLSREICDAVDENTILISFMSVNNETGAVLPADNIIKNAKIKNPGIVIHMDVVQSFCKLPVPGADILSISGHKTYAPKGVGALYFKKGIRILPIYHGGGQEYGMRPGTESVPLISAFSSAVEEIYPKIKENGGKYARMNKIMRERLEMLPCVKINSPREAASHILNFSVIGCRSEIMLHFLEDNDIFVSSGSACSNLKSQKSHVLKAMGFDGTRIDSAIRVSLGYYNQVSEVDEFMCRLEEGIERFRT